MTWQMRDYKDELVRFRYFDAVYNGEAGTTRFDKALGGTTRFDKALGEALPPRDSEIWYDQSPYHSYFYDRQFFASYTPWGVFTVYGTFLYRMTYPEAGESKRAIKREIQSNPHLHPKLKAILLKKLVKASVHKAGWGVREADADFCKRITSLKTVEEATVLRREITDHPMIPERMRENLLDNLANYERDLAA